MQHRTATPRAPSALGWLLAVALAALPASALAACDADAPAASDGGAAAASPTEAAVAAPTAVPAAPSAVPSSAARPKPAASPADGNVAGVTDATRIDAPPPLDPIALASRFRPGQPAGLATPPAVGQGDVGRVVDFWVVDLSRLQVKRVSATLHLVTARAAWYVADSARPVDGLSTLAAGFERRVYPRVAAALLGEASAHVRGWRITMLVAPLSGAAGYFNPSDAYTPGVFPYSNGRPMLYLDDALLRLGPAAFESLAAHELQHLLHQDLDATEHTWVNEGISEAAGGLLARPPPVTPPGHRHAASLTNWPEFGQASGRHYNAAHLFFAYFLQRYGGEALSGLAARPEDGIDGVDAYLAAAGRPERFDAVFQDWAAANLLGESGPGPYGYADAATLGRLTPPRTLAAGGALQGAVAPYAADYVALSPTTAGATLRFAGDATAAIIDAAPFSGASCWWGNRGDSSHSTLRQELDLTGLSAATLRFRVWHNLEEQWDYLYVAASGDGGDTWAALPGVHTVTDDPLGVTYGPGLTGRSDGWRQEQFDLSPYAGGRVLLSFEQVSDGAVSLDGACIDDVAVPELGFFDDAETDGGWEARGFVRTTNAVPQRFGVRVVLTNAAGAVEVRDMPLDAANAGRLALPATVQGGSAVVIVTSLTRHTRQPASYRLSLVDGA